MLSVLAWVLIIAAFVVLMILIVYYNRFVRLGNQIDNSLAQIDVQLRKRGDLVPNLVNAVKGYMKHEKGVIDSVNNARKALVGARDLAGRMKAGNALAKAMGSLFAIAENYPQLKASENFLQLQQELSAIEDKIAYARQYYNDGIMSYNMLTTTLPSRWFAGMYGFKKKDYLKIPEAVRSVPKLGFEE